MLELQKLLVSLGLLAGNLGVGVDIPYYRQKLDSELITKQRYVQDLKGIEYQEMWNSINSDKYKKAIQVTTLKERKVYVLQKLALTEKKVTVLQTILKKDSIDTANSKVEDNQ